MGKGWKGGGKEGEKPALQIKESFSTSLLFIPTSIVIVTQPVYTVICGAKWC